MAIREDCRHYSTRSAPTGDVLHRCRVGAAEDMPFACPPDCLFFEPRAISAAGWQVAPEDKPKGIERDL